MEDLISRQAAIDALAQTAREKFNLSDEFNHYLAGLMDGENAIRQLPSALRKKGKWIPHKLPNGEESIDKDVCSRCRRRFYQIAETGCFCNYCPNCGADMRGEE